MIFSVVMTSPERYISVSFIRHETVFSTFFLFSSLAAKRKPEYVPESIIAAHPIILIITSRTFLYYHAFPFILTSLISLPHIVPVPKTAA